MQKYLRKKDEKHSAVIEGTEDKHFLEGTHLITSKASTQVQDSISEVESLLVDQSTRSKLSSILDEQLVEVQPELYLNNADSKLTQPFNQLRVSPILPENFSSIKSDKNQEEEKHKLELLDNTKHHQLASDLTNKTEQIGESRIADQQARELANQIKKKIIEKQIQVKKQLYGYDVLYGLSQLQNKHDPSQ